MKPTVILVDHPIGKRDDRASRMIEARGFRTEWYCPGKGEDLPQPASNHVAALVYGGAENLSEDEADLPYLRQEAAWIRRWVDDERPFLGICLGAQLLARAFGAAVWPHAEGLHEIGYIPIQPAEASDGFLAEPMHVYHWHKEGFDLPDDAVLLATGEVFGNQAFQINGNAYGLQFHPEVSLNVMQRWILAADFAGR